MAHAATLSRLAEGLVTAVTGQNPTDPGFRKLRDQTLRGLKDQSHARTNQFAVKDSFNGLVEKFSVLNREDLAEALEERLQELPTNSRWMPEYLSLLLELSDKPAEKTQLDDVLHANKPDVQEPDLTWNDILADDPLDEPDIWDDIDRGYHSSEDDQLEHDVDSEPTVSTKATSVHDDDPAATARLHLVQPDEDAVRKVQELRSRWQSRQQENHALELSELMIVREILSMLRGLPADYFRLHESTGEVSLSVEAQMSNTSRSAVSSILNHSARLGTSMGSLRLWASTVHRAPYMQSMSAMIDELLLHFGRKLSAIETQLINPPKHLVVSASSVLSQVSNSANPLVHLSALVQKSLQVPAEQHSFALIDLLYDEANLAQMAGDQPAFETLACVFISGFETYLRTVSAWIKAGSLSATHSDVFFVKESRQDCEVGNLWHGQFVVRKDSQGNELVPKCLLPFADQIFALGKAKSFLRRLRDESDHSEDARDTYHDKHLLDDVRVFIYQDSLVAFSQLLSDTLEDWLFGLSTEDSVSVVSTLWSGYGLREALAAIPYVFFSKNGTLFEGFANDLGSRIAKGPAPTTSNERFILSELAQLSLGSAADVDAENLFVTMTEDESSIVTSVVRQLGAVSVRYHFSWPIQNITRCSSSEPLSRALALLLQTNHTTSRLSQRVFDLRSEREKSSALLRLRQRLLRFANILQDHITTTSNELHKEMGEQMVSAADIDSMVSIWAGYEKRLQTNLLLLPSLAPVIEALISILELGDLLASSEPQRISHLQDQLEKQITFLVAGIRSVSRAGGEPALEILAERLAAG